MLKHVEESSDQIGVRLRVAREQAGLAMEDVSHSTRIPKSVLAALEAEDFSVFSSPTYAKSFLSQYSGFLGVDAAPWLDCIEQVCFVGEDVVAPLIDGRHVSQHPVAHAEVPDKSGALAAILVLSITGILVATAVSGYRFYEARFGGEPAAGEPAAAGRNEPRGGEVPVQLVAPIPKALPVDEDEEGPPPRAIMVTEY
jgi:cytoskeletal protein RodZ